MADPYASMAEALAKHAGDCHVENKAEALSEYLDALHHFVASNPDQVLRTKEANALSAVLYLEDPMPVETLQQLRKVTFGECHNYIDFSIIEPWLRLCPCRLATLDNMSDEEMTEFAPDHRETILMALTFEAGNDSSSTTDFNECAVARAPYRIQQLAFKGGKHFEQMQEDLVTEKLDREGTTFGEGWKKFERCGGTKARMKVHAECLTILHQKFIESVDKMVKPVKQATELAAALIEGLNK